jgi:hypothetical protein
MGNGESDGAAMDDLTRVFFASTNYGPLWKPVVESWLAVVGHTARQFAVGLEWPAKPADLTGAAVTDRMYTHSAENALANSFLQAVPRLTHIFMTECDMILPHDTIIKLLAVDQPIVAGIYFLRGGKGQPCLYTKAYYAKDNPYVHSPVTVFPLDRPFPLDKMGHGGCPGLGCVLIRREVFERIPYPWFDLKESKYGSDMYFYTKVRDAKYDVWIEPSVRAYQIDYSVDGFDQYEKRLNEDKEFPKGGIIIGSDYNHRREKLSSADLAAIKGEPTPAS